LSEEASKARDIRENGAEWGVGTEI
jgi:hypothetical protein